MCRNHHCEIDKDTREYTIEKLKKMKRDHEESVYPQVMNDSRHIPADLFAVPRAFPTEIINKHVEDETRRLFQKSFYSEFDGSVAATDLYNQLKAGNLSSASCETKSTAIATLATILQRRKQYAQAKDAVDCAVSLADTQASFFAKVRICGEASNKSKFLRQLNADASPTARTAALLLKAKVDGYATALDWYATTGLRADDLDPEGQLLLCTGLLRNSHWNKAIETVMGISPETFLSMPALHHVAALTNLVATAPVEYRHSLLDHLPLNSASYPLSDKPDALEHRRRAVLHFRAAAEAAVSLGLLDTEANEERYAIWLQLMDSETETSGRTLLRKKLQPLESALPFLQLAVEFEVTEDYEAIRRELDRQRTLNGGETEYSIGTTLSILIKQDDPAAVATFIENRFDEIADFIAPSALIKTRILALATSGEGKRARNLLAEATLDELSEEDRDYIATLIDAPNTDSELEILQDRFESRGHQLSDLQTLVGYLNETKQWGNLCRYGRDLFAKTPTVGVATTLAYAYYQDNDPESLVELVLEEMSLLSHSSDLHLLYCWALHSTGDFQEARNQLPHLPPTFQYQGYSSLRINLAISTGYWENLHMYIREEFSQSRSRSAADLIAVASIATDIKHPIALQIVRAVADRGADNPEILIRCYELSERLGHENVGEVSDWLLKAVELSRPDGPVRIASPEEFGRYRQGWIKTEAHIQEMLIAAEIPMCLAAYHLGIGVVNYTLMRAVRNAGSESLREKFPIPAYYSVRKMPASNDVRNIGMDLTAILTLAYLGILETTIESFDRIMISSSTFEWLFEEHSKSTFQYARRLDNATHLLKLLDANRIECTDTRTDVAQEVTDAVGNDLVTLLCEASAASSNGSSQHIVVHPNVGFTDETLDSVASTFEEYQSFITSCSSVVDWLEKCGSMPRKELETARAFLDGNEKPWPRAAEITVGSHLYLSRLAIMYFHRLSVFGKVALSGVSVHVSNDSVEEARWIRSYGDLLGTVADKIDAVRSALVTGIDRGIVHFGRRSLLAESEGDRLVQHPSLDLISIAEGSDAVICDDRACSRYSVVHHSEKQVPILHTLNVIDIIARRGHLSCADLDTHRTNLRAAGFTMIPVTEEEIYRFLQLSKVEDGHVREIAELRAIRENLCLIRGHRWFQESLDRWWLDSMFIAVAKVMPRLWSEDSDSQRSAAYSLWLRQQFNVRHYGHFFRGDNAFEQMREYEINFVSEILHTAQDLERGSLVEFFAWFDEAMVRPFQWIDADMHSLLVKRQMDWISDLANRVFEDVESESSREFPVRIADVVSGILDRIPVSIGELILQDSEFAERFGLTDGLVLKFGQPSVGFNSSILTRAARESLEGSGAVVISDSEDREWSLGFGDDDADMLVLRRGAQQIQVDEFRMFAVGASERLQLFDKACDHYGLVDSHRDHWRQLLARGAPCADQFNAIIRDLRDTPVRVEQSIIRALEQGNVSVELIAPASSRYYARLVGDYDMSGTLESFVHGGLETLVHDHIQGISRGSIDRCLSMAIHSSVIGCIPLRSDVSMALQRCMDDIEGSGDLISQVGAIELALRSLDSVAAVGCKVASLIDAIWVDDVTSTSSRFAAFQKLFIIIDFRLVQTRVLADCPPFYRRAACLAQAALVQSVFERCGVPAEALGPAPHESKLIFHHLQSLGDMRLEPRWHPAYASPSHFKANLCMRISRALQFAEARFGSSRVEQFLGQPFSRFCDGGEFSVEGLFPSPVEGGIQKLPPVPAESLESLRSGLRESMVDCKAFHSFATTSLFCSIDDSTIDVALDAMDRSLDGLVRSAGPLGTSSVLNVLAMAAGRTRCAGIADRIHPLLLGMLRQGRGDLDVGRACEIGLVACSCSAGFGEWRDRVSSWFGALCQLPLDSGQAAVLAWIVETLCYLYPELWMSCGKSYAELDAVRHGTSSVETR